MVRTALYGLAMLWVSLPWLNSSGSGVWASEENQGGRSLLYEAPSGPFRKKTPTSLIRSQFVRKIEPILIGTCASSGCHGSDSTRPFRLDRLAIEGAGHPGLTRQNLANVLRQLDAVDLHGDSLLKYATTVHGSGGHPFKPLNTRQVEILRGWIRLVEVATVEKAKPALRMKPDLADSLQDLPHLRDFHHVRTLQRGVRLSRFEPRDPFDAEIFNRRVASTVERRKESK